MGGKVIQEGARYAVLNSVVEGVHGDGGFPGELLRVGVFGDASGGVTDRVGWGCHFRSVMLVEI